MIRPARAAALLALLPLAGALALAAPATFAGDPPPPPTPKKPAPAGKDEKKSDPKKDDGKKDDKKKEKDKDTPETPLLNNDAEAPVEKLAAKIDAGDWVEVFAGAREIADKHASELVLAVPGLDAEAAAKGALHVPASTALRWQLARVPAEGRTELARLAADEPAQRLDSARASLEPAQLVDAGDRAFYLDLGADALIEAGDLYVERGNVLAAFFAWRSVLERHWDARERSRAARRLVATLPLVGDPATARSLARAIRRSPDLEDRDALVARVRAVAARLDQAEVPDQAILSNGAIAPLGSALVLGSDKHRIELDEAEVPKQLDWRNQHAAQEGNFGVPVLTVRRLISPAAVTRDWLFLHYGRAVLVYNVRTGARLDWQILPYKVTRPNLSTYLTSLTHVSVLARYGIAIDGEVAYATVRKGSKAQETGTPRGTLVKVRLPDPSDGGEAKGALLWDATSTEPAPDEDDDSGSRRKKKDASPVETPAEEALSFTGTPLAAGDRVFCGASLAGSPSQTFVVALDAETGTVLWKRALASTDAYNTTVQQWEQPIPRVLPTPQLTLAEGALVVLSNNGSVAALDGQDGRIIWARSYERQGNEHTPRNPWSRMASDFELAEGFGENPVLALQDVGVLCPADTEKLLLVRLSTGELLSSHSRKAQSGGVYRYLLGNWGPRLVLEGGGEIAAYDLVEVDDPKGSHYELSSVWEDKVGKDGSESGRGFLAGHWALVPNDKRGIVGFDVASEGELAPTKRIFLDGFPTHEEHEGEDTKLAIESGDLVVAGRRFVVVGARTSHVYALKKHKKKTAHPGEGR